MLGELLLSTAITAFGVVLAFVLVRSEPQWYFAFVAAGLAGGRDPSATTELLRETLYSGGEGELSSFAMWLFGHNSYIGLLSFALGFAAGVPTALLLFTNGLMLGAFMALFDGHGLLIPLLGWILPHGVPEFGALILCGAAGLHVGRHVLAPGTRTFRDALVWSGQRGATVAAGSVLLFLVAGVIEGVFRQVVVLDLPRFLLALFNALWLFAWLALSGRAMERVSDLRPGGRALGDRARVSRALGDRALGSRALGGQDMGAGRPGAGAAGGENVGTAEDAERRAREMSR